ncbi:hypothetical protein AGABI2DRAFT_194376, partial [Agaricus bisporus var. bisporus H97]|uniref:hypothetical protein n=1 Tax=Agaricus bisporus var. bisporus (strain H97 / ATCC MYA-4626 / FGSC 10389) TaxID=936046 RepID=UPI00029F5D1F
MFSSKFFSLLTFAAAAVAQEIPVGPFFIADFESKLVLEAGFMGSDPNLESFIFLSERNESNNAQMWSTDGYGTLTNEASKRVLEVHTTNDVIIHGTKLQLAYKNETGHLGNQAWAYNPV